jgi:hypothetical protein
MFEREDWTAFRTVDGLYRKAGAAQDRLTEVVIKELVDNSLDAAGDCELWLSDSRVIVQDRGPGIPGDDEAIGRLFSMNRPLTSTKYLRLPARGALGNGLRVVVGAVAATQGSLYVATGGRKLQIITDPLTGQSEAVRVGDFDEPGTRIEMVLGRPLEPTPDDLLTSEIAIVAARAQERRYAGKTSPHWYDAAAFHDLLLSIQSADMTAREFLMNFDGCSASAGSLVDGFSGRPAKGLTLVEATLLLQRAKASAREVNPQRLGAIGKDAFAGAYASEACFAVLPPAADGTCVNLPVVVEAWADPDPEESDAVFMVNGTPCIADASAWYEPKEKTTVIYGPGLRFDVKTGRTGMYFHVNIITPYMPVTSDGKAPALGMFRPHFQSVIAKAARRAKKIQPREDLKPNIKSAVFSCMEEQICIVSDHRRYRFNWRQVFYRVRPIVKQSLGEDLGWDYFSQTLVTDYEAKHGEERMAYRDPRGTFYSPHDGESFPLGTLQVERFQRLAWQYNKALFVEKEGFFEALKAVGWPERHDCALVTSKGQPTRAARDLVDLLGGTEEPIQVFCLHDCDAAGTMIFQSLQEATRARPRRSLEIVNLGLDPIEAGVLADRGMVEVEDVSYEKRQPVAEYADEFGEWLQTHRVELNALTTAQFIEWLDQKMADFARKVIPPADVLSGRLTEIVRQRVRERIVDRVLSEARVDDRVDEELSRLDGQMTGVITELPKLVATSLDGDPQQHWRDAVGALAERVAVGTD